MSLFLFDFFFFFLRSESERKCGGGNRPRALQIRRIGQDRIGYVLVVCELDEEWVPVWRGTAVIK